MSEKHRRSNKEVKKPKQAKKSASGALAPAFAKGTDPLAGPAAKKPTAGASPRK